jgi:hypothetical protein
MHLGYGEIAMTKLEETVFKAIGAASMCWSETPTGIYDSSRAKQIAEDLIKEINNNRELILESLILGHMNAMRPLLNEWEDKNRQVK